MLRRVASDSVVYGSGLVASRFVYIFLLPFYLRLFTLTDYGVLELLLTTGSILLLVSDLQIISGVLREYYEAKAERRSRELVGTALTLHAVSATVWVAAGLLIFSEWGYRAGGAVRWVHVAPILLGLLPNEVFTLFQVILRLEAQKLTFVFVSLFDLVTSSLLSVAFAAGLHWGIAGVLWGMALSKVLWSVALIRILRTSFTFTCDLAAAKRILTYGVPMVPGALAQWAQSYSSRFLLAALLTLADVALFSFAARLTSVIAMVDLAFRQAWEPHAMRVFGETNGEVALSRAYKVYLYGMFLFCTIVAFAGPCTVGLIAGKRYVPAGSFIGFLAYASLWNGSSGILSSGNSWERKTYWNGLGVLTGVVLNVGIVWLFSRRLGLPGVGAAALIASLGAVGVTFTTAQRNHPIPYDKAEILGVAGASLALGYLSYAIYASHWFKGLSAIGQLGISVSAPLVVLALVAAMALKMLRSARLGELPTSRPAASDAVLSVGRN